VYEFVLSSSGIFALPAFCTKRGGSDDVLVCILYLTKATGTTTWRSSFVSPIHGIHLPTGGTDPIDASANKSVVWHGAGEITITSAPVRTHTQKGEGPTRILLYTIQL
jgi:hypothetical protein